MAVTPVVYNQPITPRLLNTLTGAIEAMISDAVPTTNVRTSGAAGDGVTDDTASVQAAIDTGRAVYFPKGQYRITGTLTAATNGQMFFGDGADANASEILFANGALDGFVVGSLAAATSAVAFRNIRLAGSSKTAGAILRMIRCTRGRLDNVVVANPWDGISLESFNEISLRDVIIAGIAGDYGLQISGTDTNRWDVCTITNLRTSPDNTTRAGRPTGILIDGPGSTVQIHAAANIRMGRGLWTRNTGGYTGAIAFVEAHAFESDFSEYEAIKLDNGNGFLFANTYAHGSTLGQGITIGSAVTNVQFHGGNVTGHEQDGMVIDGDEVALGGLAVARNSVSSTGTYNGINIGAAAKGVRLYGVMAGRRNNLSGLQNYGVTVAAGAERVSLTGCDLSGNVIAEGLNDLSGGEVSVVGCAGTTAPYCGRLTEPLSLGNQGQTMLRVGNTTATTVANRLRVAGASTGLAPSINVEGEANTGIQIAVLGTGTGRLRHDSTDALTWDSTRVDARYPLRLPSYTVATLPSVGTHERSLIYVSDGTGDKRLAVSTGVNWRWPDGTIVS